MTTRKHDLDVERDFCSPGCHLRWFVGEYPDRRLTRDDFDDARLLVKDGVLTDEGRAQLSKDIAVVGRPRVTASKVSH